MEGAGRRLRLRDLGLAGLAGAGLLALLALAPGAARAAVINVNTTADVYLTPGTCSLREAISSANVDGAFGGCTAGSGNDVIVIPEGIYRLTIPRGVETVAGIDNARGDLDVTDLATLRPRRPLDRVIVDANGTVIDDRVLQTTAVGDGLTIERLTLTGGSGSTGGAIRAQGGAVLTLNRVTVAGNASNLNGGGLILNGSSTLTAINSTISDNRSNISGGGLRVATGTATLRNTTVASNVADADGTGNGDGGGLSIGAGETASLLNTLIAANADRGGEAPDCENDGTLTSTGATLIGTLAGCPGYAPGPGDVLGVAPRLRPLAFNGGTNATRALLPRSPAVNRGAGCVAIDQRGLPRGFGGRCDIGAYELARCAGAIVNRVGTNGPDRLIGTNRRDGILALSGNDRVLARRGNDGLCGLRGRDLLFGQGGFDRLAGSLGDDLLVGGARADLALGGPGLDRLYGQDGFDRLFGGLHLDRLFGGRGRDLLNGQRGPDRCYGGPHPDVAVRCAVRRGI